MASADAPKRPVVDGPSDSLSALLFAVGNDDAVSLPNLYCESETSGVLLVDQTGTGANRAGLTRKSHLGW
jgi:hypothetical protein